MGNCVGNQASKSASCPQRPHVSTAANANPQPPLVIDAENESKRTETDVVAIQHSQVIPKYHGSISDLYHLAPQQLGAGAFGTVSRAIHRKTGVVRAIKAVPHRDKRTMRMLHTEIMTLQIMSHPNVIKLFEACNGKATSHLVMEICEGGDLLDRVIAAGFLPENQAAGVMQQMLRALHYMHSLDLAHRDLKPQNLLFVSKDGVENNTLKLIDFGLACTCRHGDTLHSCVGSAFYVAPEVLDRKYGKQCDVWSAGVILYALLSGRVPFDGSNDFEILQRVKKGHYSLEGSIWRYGRDDAKDLIHQMMKKSPQERLTAEQALQHIWIAKRSPAVQKVIDWHLVERLQSFRVRNKLERAVLKILAHHLSEDEVKDLRAAFESLDANGDGVLTMEELSSGLSRAGFDNEGLDVRCMMAMADANGNGKINYSEFLVATLDWNRHLGNDALLAAFGVFDTEGKGCITEQNLRQVLCCCPRANADCCQPELLRLMREWDLAGNSCIDFGEFKSMMHVWKAEVCTGTSSTWVAAHGGA